MLKRFSSTPSISPEHRSPVRSYLANFVAAAAGSTMQNQLRAGLGALMGIGLTGSISALAFGTDTRLPLIVAPMGASAVLLFAVPASPLAQPWSIIGGNTVSVLVGIAVAQLIHEPMAATGIAVGLAIVVMSLARCLHPPGGAAALTAIIGGPSVAAAGFAFALVPVFLNAVLLVLLGIVYHRFSGGSYPHNPTIAPSNLQGGIDLAAPKSGDVRPLSIDAAINELEEPLDVDRCDLEKIFSGREKPAHCFLQNAFSGIDLATRDMVSLASNESVQVARPSPVDRGLTSLAAVDPSGRLAGMAELGEPARGLDRVAGVRAAAIVATPDAALSDLIKALLGEKEGSVVLSHKDGRILGLVSSVDILLGLLHIRRSDPRLANSLTAPEVTSTKERQP